MLNSLLIEEVVPNRLYIYFIYTLNILDPLSSSKSQMAKQKITPRITIAENSFYRLMKPLCSHRKIIKMKVRVYIATISILLCGYETIILNL